jgi:hypothetical protein
VLSDADEVAAVLAQSRLRVALVAGGVLLVVVVAVVIAQFVGPGGAVPTAAGVIFPLPWLVGALAVAGRPSRPPRFSPKHLNALTMSAAFGVIYLNQAGHAWVITAVFMAGAAWGMGLILTLPFMRWQLKRHPWLIHDRARVAGATLTRLTQQ